MKPDTLPYRPVAPLFMSDQKRLETLGEQAERVERWSNALAGIIVGSMFVAACVAIYAAASVQRGGV